MLVLPGLRRFRVSESRLGWAVSLALATTLAAAQDPAKQPVAGAPRQSTEPSVQEINDRFVQQIAERIVGRENELAGQVFKNMRIDWLKTTPARQLRDIMNGGYARARRPRHALPRGERLFERRQAAETRRPRNGGDASGREPDAREDGEPDVCTGGTLHQLRDVSSRQDRSARRATVSQMPGKGPSKARLERAQSSSGFQRPKGRPAVA